MQFVDNLLYQEIHNLRLWGVEGTDYNKNEKGGFSHIGKMKTCCADTTYKASHMCTYSYFPQWSETT